MAGLAQSYLFFLVAILLSSILSSALGIGGYVLIPLFALHFGAKASVAAVTVYFLIQNFSKLLLFWRHADLNVAWRLSIYALPGAIFGSYLLVLMPAHYFQQFLGVGLLIFLVLPHVNANLKPSDHRFLVPVFGILYGVSSGMLGSGNAVKGPMFTSLNLLKERYVATYALTSAAMNIPKLMIYGFGDVLTTESWYVLSPLLLISLVGTYLGKRLMRFISETWFEKITLAAFGISAIALLFGKS
jgi:uncharacterized protein